MMTRSVIVLLLALLSATALSAVFTVEDVRKANEGKAVRLTLSEVQRKGYAYTPSTPLDDYTKEDKAECECNCHVSDVDSSTPFECFCICPRQPGGKKGQKGVDGLKGAMGPRGPKGEKGPKGEIGYPGDAGPQGVTGPKGDPGDEGKPGLDAVDGGDFAGPVGPAGPPGDIFPGMRGVVGPTGPRGPQGDQGPKGNSAMGGAGAVGKQGAKGRKGKDGPMGDQGAQGERGQVGPIGPDGPMAGDLDETSLYIKSIASAACASYSTGKRNSFALFRSQANPMVCGDTCATLCAKSVSTSATCLGGMWIPTEKEGLKPASKAGEIGLLAYRFPVTVCETAGCDQANWCCCSEAGAEYRYGPQSLAGLMLWLSADKIDQADPTEIGSEGSVKTWTDYSGNGFTAAAVKGQEPRLEIQKLNALPVVRFGFKNEATGKYTSSWLTLGENFTPAAGTKGLTAFAVARVVSGKAPLFDFGVYPKAGFGMMLGINTEKGAYDLQMYTPGTDKSVSVPFKTAGFVIATYQIEYGVAMRAMVNPEQLTWGLEANIPTVRSLTRSDVAASKVPAEGSGVPSIGHSSELVKPDQSFVGEIAELMMYEAVLTKAEINTIVCYLTAKYAVGVCTN